MLQDTIAAIATANQDGAISIIRMSGDQALEIADTLFSRALKDTPSHSVQYGYIIDPLHQEAVDEVLVSVFLPPKTFTRETVVEISCHGGRFITRKILKLCLAQGARLAQPGEFTRRAFLNGRIDLTQAEAVQDIIEADTDANARLAVNGIKGSVRTLLDPLIQGLLDIIAHIEVNIDYPEYDDVEQLTNEQLLPLAYAWQNKIKEIIQRSESGKMVKDGIATAIVGRPNVGKSSLLNALLEEEKAIVTDVEGTTRDIVEGRVQLGDIILHLIDTAGIRETQDVVERIGIERSMKAMKDAQLIIVVLDGSQPLQEEDQLLLDMTKDNNRIVVYNKADLCTDKHMDDIYISAASQKIDPLLIRIKEMYEQQLILLEEPILANERQIAKMMQAELAMRQAVQAMEDGMELDLVTIDLQEAYTALKEILGEVHREDLLDTLFSSFCLGK